MIEPIDGKLIQLLMHDADQNSESLAAKLKVSASTVRRRRRKLTQTGVLRNAIVVDPTKAGFPVSAIIAFDVINDKIELVAEQLARRPEITYLGITTGRFDMWASAWFHSMDECGNFLGGILNKIDGVRDTETFITFRVVKGLQAPRLEL